MKNKRYFTKIHEDYRKASEYSDQLYQNIGGKLNGILAGTVVDIGNGGIINYDTENIEKLICIDLIFNEGAISDSKIDFIHGDFYQIDLLEKVDCILTQFLLHHLVEDNKLRDSIKKISNKLRNNGNFIVVEIAVPRWVEFAQNISKRLIFALLSLLNKPGLRFFSEKSLIRLLIECGFGDVRVERIDIGKKVSPAPVLFPQLRIPGKLYPFECILIEAKNTK